MRCDEARETWKEGGRWKVEGGRRGRGEFVETSERHHGVDEPHLCCGESRHSLGRKPTSFRSHFRRNCKSRRDIVMKRCKYWPMLAFIMSVNPMGCFQTARLLRGKVILSWVGGHATVLSCCDLEQIRAEML